MTEPQAGARVALTTLGCKVNRADSEMVAATLLRGGVRVQSGHESVDAVVINTCCVTQEAERKVRKAVRRALRSCEGPVFVTGCLASLGAEELAALDERVSVIANPAEAANEVLERFPDEAGGDMTPSGIFRTRVALKVEDGCDCSCAYCIVPAARGNPVSVPLANAVGDARALVDAGTAEIVLTGINLGRWSDGDRTLPDLVRGIAETGVERLRLSSIEPQHLDSRLVEVLSAQPSVCPHLHVPLQTGSDRLLRAMGRQYDPARFVEVVRAAAAALPGLVVTTDVIAGLPGETQDDHVATMALIESLSDVVRKLHVFRYSSRPGTRAASMPDHVDARTIDVRASELRALGERLQSSHLAEAVGSEVRVLVERVDGDSGEGTTSEYLKARIERSGLVVGTVETARVTGADGMTAVCA